MSLELFLEQLEAVLEENRLELEDDASLPMGLFPELEASNSFRKNNPNTVRAVPAGSTSPVGLMPQVLWEFDGSLGEWLASLDDETLNDFCADLSFADAAVFGIIATLKEGGEYRDAFETCRKGGTRFRICAIVEGMRREGLVRIMGDLGMTTNAMVETIVTTEVQP